MNVAAKAQFCGGELATAARDRDEAYADADKAWADAAWPAWATYVGVEASANAQWVDTESHAYAGYEQDVAAAQVALVSAIAPANVTYAHDVAQAWADYNVTMTGIGRDMYIASAQLNVAQVNAADPSTFSYIYPQSGSSSAPMLGGVSGSQRPDAGVGTPAGSAPTKGQRTTGRPGGKPLLLDNLPDGSAARHQLGLLIVELYVRAPTVPGGTNQCHRWTETARDMIIAHGRGWYDNEYYKIEYIEWRFPPRGGWIEHGGLRITFANGEVAYLDNWSICETSGVSYPEAYSCGLDGDRHTVAGRG